jgi:hypothetical protein
VPTISVLRLAYRCSEENIGEEFYNDFEEFYWLVSPPVKCLWKRKTKIRSVVIVF